MEDQLLAGGGLNLQGITADDADDYRILDSLPMGSASKNKTTTENVDPLLNKLLL